MAIMPNHAELPFRISKKKNDIPGTETAHKKSSTCFLANFDIMHVGGHSTLSTLNLVISNLLPLKRSKNGYRHRFFCILIP
jgi:hypothetical protein